MAYFSNQEADNLTGADAIAKIHEIAKAAGTCMMYTGLSYVPPHGRPMAVQDADADGMLWFISGKGSGQNEDISQDATVMLCFQNHASYEYMVVNGSAQVFTDRETIEKYWSDAAAAWFDGVDDPRVSIIAVRAESGHYWDVKHGKIVSLAKMAMAAITGNKATDIGVTGELQP